jgi:hypothetical protein
LEGACALRPAAHALPVKAAHVGPSWAFPAAARSLTGIPAKRWSNMRRSRIVSPGREQAGVAELDPFVAATHYAPGADKRKS